MSCFIRKRKVIFSMAKGTRQILLTFVFIFAACTFGLFTLSTLGQRWYSCRSASGKVKKSHVDLIFTLWEYCTRQTNGKYVCYNIDDAPKLNEVFLGKKNFLYTELLLRT